MPAATPPTMLKIFRDLPLTLKFSVIPLIACIGFGLGIFFSWTTASLNAQRLQQIQHEITPAIEVANANSIRLESIVSTLEAAVSTGDSDLVASTRQLSGAFLRELGELQFQKPKTMRIARECNAYFSLAQSLSLKIIDRGNKPVDEEFRSAVKAERQAMQAGLASCRELTWGFKRDMTAVLDGAIQQANVQASNGLVWALILGVVTLAVIVVVGYFVTANVGALVDQLTSSLDQMQLDDGLTSGFLRCDSRDELGQLAEKFNLFIGRLRNLLKTAHLQKEEIEKQNREIEELNRDLLQLATTDKLTRLKNFAYFQEELDRRIQEIRRAQTKPPLSLIIVDVDYFKRFNDSYGHQAGNLALQEVAGKLRKLVRKVDTACRYGGEEFVLILPNCALAGAITLAERIRLAVERDPIEVNHEKVPLTVSLGVAEYQIDESAVHFVERTDGALYRAKQHGRNRVESSEWTPAPAEPPAPATPPRRPRHPAA